MFRKTITFALVAILAQTGFGQATSDDLSGKINTLTYAVPFLTIPVNPTLNGVISSVPDGTAGPTIYGNPGLLALNTHKVQATLDYVPWLRYAIPDMYLACGGGSYRLNNRHALGASFRYFSLANLSYTSGGVPKTFHPNEWAGTLFYSYHPDEHTGLGVGIRYIHSNLTGGNNVGGIESHPGKSLALDLGFAKQIPGSNGRVDHFIGVYLNNLGTKISYTQNSDKDFIPTALTAGYGLRLNIGAQQSLTVSYECAKLLIPTPPFYYADSVDANQDPVIEDGYDPNVGVFRGMIQSFYDAPAGFEEELAEITHSLGVVYRLGFLSAGAGYHHESATKGNRRFFTAGLSANVKLGRSGAPQIRATVSCRLPVHQSNYNRNSVQAGLNFTI